MQKFISSSVCKNFEDSVKFAKKLGTNIEISRFARDLADIDETFDSRVQAMKKALENFDGEVSLHGFLFDLCVVSLDPLIRKVSRQRFMQTYEAAKILGAKTVLFHTGFNAPLKCEDYRRSFRKNFIAYLKDFVKNFEESGMVMVLENVQETGPEFILDIIENVGSNNLKASLDIGHANIHSEIPVTEWIKTYGENLYHMHIHNNYGDDDSHFSLSDGNIDAKAVFRTVLECGLNPKIIFEIFEKKAVIESIAILDEVLNTSNVIQARPKQLEKAG